MKITKSQLKQIIMEELSSVLSEDGFDQIRSESSLRGQILDQMLKKLPAPPNKASVGEYPQEFFASALFNFMERYKARVMQDSSAREYGLYAPLLTIANQLFREFHVGDPNQNLSFNTHWDKPAVQQYLTAAATALANYIEETP
tara:strand:- start:56 stop:487 length:432 start_codon:yes stop_codon:yes gene_type:complete